MSKSHDSFIFRLPIAEYMLGVDLSDLKSISWQVDEKSARLFENARDGQGFSIIVGLDRSAGKESVIATIHLHPAFNGLDGLPRENKYGEKYSEFTDSKVARDLAGSGVIHQEHSKFLLKKRLLQDSAVRLGGGLIKGSESTDEKNYTVVKLSKSESSLVTEAYRNKQGIQLENYSPEKKYLVLCENSEGNYEIYYVQNQKLVYVPHVKSNTPIPIIEKEKLNILDEKQLVQECLKKLNLYYPFTVMNRSASQNNISISYDLDFECYAMYWDPQKNNLISSEGNYIPEGRVYGSLFELRRSIPPVLMQRISSTLENEFKVTSEKDKQKQLEEWSPWSISSFDQLVSEFKNASPEDKLKKYFENIKISLELYKESLLLITSAHENVRGALEPQQVVNEFTRKYPHLKLFNSMGDVLYGFFDPYLAMLQYRLKCLISLSLTLESQLTSVKYSDELPKMINDVCIKVDEAYRNLHLGQIAEWCKQHLENIQIAKLQNQPITEIEEKRFVNELLSDAKLDVMLHFSADAQNNKLRGFLKRQYEGNEEKIRDYMARLINTAGNNNKTPMQNAIERGWFDVVAMFVSYGAKLDNSCLLLLEKNKEKNPALFDTYKDRIFPMEKLKKHMNEFIQKATGIINLHESAWEQLTGKDTKKEFFEFLDKAKQNNNPSVSDFNEVIEHVEKLTGKSTTLFGSSDTNASKLSALVEAAKRDLSEFTKVVDLDKKNEGIAPKS